MTEFVSEPIAPRGRRFDVAAMGRGEPGLPAAFTWRGQSMEIAETLKAWKQSQAEGGRPGGERYLRRHCYQLKMADGTIWTVYFTRQPSTQPAARRRWFLYTIDSC